MKVFVKGKGEVSLGKGDFVASGGFGDVYARAGVAYKIYQKPTDMIPVQKIDELGVLTDVNIIKPLDVLLDVKNKPIGYTMRFLQDTYSLCQLFPKAFRVRNSLTPDLTLGLVRMLQTQVEHCHAKGITLVDINELNELVSKDFKEIFTIDVDNFKTKSYPAQGLMESVRDHHAPVDPHNPKVKIYDEKSDWFSFAVVVFNLFFGIHPYKGKHPTFTDLTSRMINNITVRCPDVQYPQGSVLPFDSAPEIYLNWLDAVLSRGERISPPDDLNAKIQLVTKLKQVVGSNHLDISKLVDFAEEVVAYYYNRQSPVTITRKSIYLDRVKVMDCHPDVVVVFTPKLDRPIAARVEGGFLKLLNVVAKSPIPINLTASQLMVCNGRLVCLSSGSFVEISFSEMGGNVVPVPKLVGNAFELVTTMYDGVAVQNLLGLWVADIFTELGHHYYPKLTELASWKVLDAKAVGRVLQVVAVNVKSGKYSRFVYRFSEDFEQRDVREVVDITPGGLNFVIKGSIVVQITEQSEIEIFPVAVGASSVKVIQDSSISADMKLGLRGAGIVFSRGNELYNIAMK